MTSEASGSHIEAGITFLKVSDLAASSEFYGGSLGLTLVLDQGGCHIFRLTGSSFVGLCERESAPSSNLIVTIVTADVDAWYDRLSSAGVSCDAPPRDNSDYGIYHFFSEDPDGHLLEVQRFWDDHWADA
jgi:catechol 2,3-dioxygenase-like lactoylglutathione lyase family enzyme